MGAQGVVNPPGNLPNGWDLRLERYYCVADDGRVYRLNRRCVLLAEKRPALVAARLNEQCILSVAGLMKSMSFGPKFDSRCCSAFAAMISGIPGRSSSRFKCLPSTDRDCPIAVCGQDRKTSSGPTRRGYGDQAAIRQRVGEGRSRSARGTESLQTLCRRRQSRANSSLFCKFPVRWKIQGISLDWTRPLRFHLLKQAVNAIGYAANSRASRAGNFFDVSGN